MRRRIVLLSALAQPRLASLTGASLATLIGLPLQAQPLVTQALELQHASGSELLAVIEPLVPAPGAVRVFRNQLIIRTTPENLTDIRRLLASLDRAPVNLLIHVRRTEDEVVRRDLAAFHADRGLNHALVQGREASGSLAASGKHDSQATYGRAEKKTQTRVPPLRGKARITRSRNELREQRVQSVAVLDGHEAFIAAGEAVPVYEYRIEQGPNAVDSVYSTRYESFTEGFFVRPRLAGDDVVLEIRPSRRTRVENHDDARLSELGTTLTVPLERWISIGGSRTGRADQQGTLSAGTSVQDRNDLALFIKVQRLP